MQSRTRSTTLRLILACQLAAWMISFCSASLAAQPSATLAPLLETGKPVDWWFVFKFNAATLPGCAGGAQRTCLFGGNVNPAYKQFSQQFAWSSSSNPSLQLGGGCLGDSTVDPLGATFAQVYGGNFFYVLWNDQFYGDPIKNEDAPAGHSKGMLAWDNDGNGFVLQVSTPSWPASGNSKAPRLTDGNTLGCVHDNDVKVSQHFLALKLTSGDVVAVLKALKNANAVTDPSKPQIVNNGGPAAIQTLVQGLGPGRGSPGNAVTKVTLSSGVILISKPSSLHVPPWQMVSALLGGEPLRTASWWATPKIPTTTASTPVGCWDPSLGQPGAVEIATTGTWAGQPLGLEGVDEPAGNHAKIGVSTGSHSYSIFGDMNQQGSLSGPNCESSQNGRGGLFYVIDDPQLFKSVRDLIQGGTAPAQ